MATNGQEYRRKLQKKYVGNCRKLQEMAGIGTRKAGYD